MPHKKKFIFILIFSFLYTSLFAQDEEKIAAINLKLNKEKTDTSRVLLFNDLFIQYREYDSAKAMEYANKAIELSKKSAFKKGESLLLLNKGVF